ncbi:uncharacterized protein FFE2_03238 [Fusarium fujikuroi]|nr:uncharacterized protein FFE2_03238 [Fusarium fujikuroi]
MLYRRGDNYNTGLGVTAGYIVLKA